MILIGEKLNSSLKSINKAIKEKDAEVIKAVAQDQSDTGADYIDVNCGTFSEEEPKLLAWMIGIIQQHLDRPLCIDSPNPNAIKAALEINKNGKPIINSITAEKARFDSIHPLVLEYNTSIIALCMDDGGIPDTVDKRLLIGEKLVNDLVKLGVAYEDIFIDPMIQPLAVDHNNGLMALDTIKRVKNILPGIKTVCGLSNISYGLPGRKNINRAFLTLAMSAGLDAAILDTLDADLMGLMHSTELLLGQDEYCLNYITAFRNMEK